MAVLKAVQRAFYAEAKDVTRPEVLADLAEQFGISRVDFAKAFASTEMRDMTAADFELAIAIDALAKGIALQIELVRAFDAIEAAPE